MNRVLRMLYLEYLLLRRVMQQSFRLYRLMEKPHGATTPDQLMYATLNIAPD